MRKIVPHVKSGRMLKPETLDRKHAATKKAIERLPASMTRTYTNAPNPAPRKK